MDRQPVHGSVVAASEEGDDFDVRWTMSSVVDLRQKLAHREDCRFVTPAEFLKHLTSHSNLERCDEPAANLLGLKFTGTGRRLFVPQEEFSRLVPEEITSS